MFYPATLENTHTQSSNTWFVSQFVVARALMLNVSLLWRLDRHFVWVKVKVRVHSKWFNRQKKKNLTTSMEVLHPYVTSSSSWEPITFGTSYSLGVLSHLLDRRTWNHGWLNLHTLCADWTMAPVGDCAIASLVDAIARIPELFDLRLSFAKTSRYQIFEILSLAPPPLHSTGGKSTTPTRW